MQSRSWIRIFVVSSLAMVAAAAVVGGCSGSGSGGGDGGFSGSMSGSQVVPEVTTIHAGSFSLIITADEMYVNIVITHDVPDLTAAAIHGPALAGETAPVLFDVLANQTNIVVARGDLINSPIESQWPITAEQLVFLRDGQTYVQLASFLFPDGEVRGQINGAAEPEPEEGNVEIIVDNFTYIEGTFFELGDSLAREKALDIRISSSYNISLDWELRVPFDWGLTVPDGITISDPDPKTRLLLLDGPNFPANSEHRIPLGLSTAPMDAREIDCFFLAADPETGLTLESFNAPIMRNFRPFTHLQYLDMTGNEIGGTPVVDAFHRYTFGLPLLSVRLSFDGSGLRLGTGSQQISGGMFQAGLNADVWTRTLAAFPCGSFDGGNGLVVCPFDQGAVSPGPWFYVAMLLDDVVPLADPTNSYQYGFVFDTDGNPDNNFRPAKGFENDFFQDTDWWYSLEYNPSDGWRLFNIDARTPGTPQRQFSDASVIIWGNMVFLVAPRTEFLSDSPAVRLTAFCHPGDFGAGGTFNLDFDPAIGEPLLENPIVLPLPPAVN